MPNWKAVFAVEPLFPALLERSVNCAAVCCDLKVRHFCCVRTGFYFKLYKYLYYLEPSVVHACELPLAYPLTKKTNNILEKIAFLFLDNMSEF